MAAYYTNSSGQREALPTIYLRDSGHAPYAESSLPGNMMYLNYSSSTMYSDAMPGSSQMLPTTSMLSQESSVGGSSLVATRIEGSYFNAWRDGSNEMMQPARGPRITDDVVLSSVSDDPQMGFRTELNILGRQTLSQQPPNISSVQGQGLSLSLSTQIPIPSFHYQPANPGTSFVASHQSDTGNSLYYTDRGIHVEPSPGLTKLACPIKNSKYLKAAQQLLDEVVNVQKALKQKTDKNHAPCGITKVNDGESKSDENQNAQESTANSVSNLSPTKRQDLHDRMTKLLAMLDEVDRRYKQYYHQMQIVVSSFDVIAGRGTAKPYTALALQTISRHFRCLRDAIDSQIRATGKSLGEEDPSGGKEGGRLSRLRYIDQQIRQQKAFQQFGMMQQHAWRPQRGLPETSVTILRAWLFEHFLHPYPKDSDKLILARQTGLTRNQVSNWFINARVRLWKPMVEEMYKEEFGNTEVDSNSENALKGKNDIRSSENSDDSPNLESASERCHSSHLSDSSKSGLIHDVQMDIAVTGFQNEVTRSERGYMDLRLGEQRPPTEDGSLLRDVFVQTDGSSRYMAYQMAELGKYGNGGVSLTLGLQHCDGDLTVSEGHQGFVAVRGVDIYGPAALGADVTDYDCLNLVDRQQRFSSSQLLHDFVA